MTAAITALTLTLAQTPARADATDPPAPQIAMNAFSVVDGWVRAWSVPASVDEAAQLPPVAAAAVTLRLDGRVIGRGVWVDQDLTDNAIWRAATKAFRQAATRLPSDLDADFDAGIEASSKRMTLSLELAGALVPMSKSETASAGVQIRPGIDGVAVRLGGVFEATFPAVMLTRGGDAGRSITAMVIELSGDGGTAAVGVDELIERGFAFYRFSSVQIAQPAAGLAGVFLHRGGRVVPRSQINRSELRSFADALAWHLMLRRWPGSERYGLTGDYNPFVGRSDPLVAPPIEQALVSYALSRYAATPHMDEPGAFKARQLAATLLRDLAVVEPGEAKPWAEFPDAAACLIALSMIPVDHIGTDSDLTRLRDECSALLAGAFSAESGFDRSVPPLARGLIAWALVRTADASSDLGNAAVRTVYRQTPPGMLVGQMPYLGWAEIELAQRAGDPIAAASALRSMREQLWRHQLTPGDVEPADRDLAGGIVFTAGSAPLPTWHTLRPLAFAATMLGVEGLTPGGATWGEVPAELGNLIDSLRFVRQLAAGPEEAHAYRRPARAMHGIRSSMWDHTMGTEASALALLTVCESLESMAKIAQRHRPEPAAEPGSGG